MKIEMILTRSFVHIGSCRKLNIKDIDKNIKV